MYVCVCNAKTEREIRRSIEQGASTPKQVYDRMGCKPECGQCRKVIRGMIDGESGSSGRGA